MSRRWLLVGVAGVLVVAGAGVAIHASRSGPATSPVTISSATKAFAAKGIALDVATNMGLAPGEKGHPLGFLWNQPHASGQGLVEVIVLRSADEARGVIQYGKQLDLSSRDTCGRTLAVDYATYRARNLVATFFRCDYTHTPNQLAPVTAESTVSDVMQGLAG